MKILIASITFLYIFLLSLPVAAMEETLALYPDNKPIAKLVCQGHYPKERSFHEYDYFLKKIENNRCNLCYTNDFFKQNLKKNFTSDIIFFNKEDEDHFCCLEINSLPNYDDKDILEKEVVRTQCNVSPLIYIKDKWDYPRKAHLWEGQYENVFPMSWSYIDICLHSQFNVQEFSGFLPNIPTEKKLFDNIENLGLENTIVRASLNFNYHYNNFSIFYLYDTEEELNTALNKIDLKFLTEEN